MYLTRHETPGGARWALDGGFSPSFTLEILLQLPKAAIADFLRGAARRARRRSAPLLAPVEPTQEVWAAGVTYLRSRDAREEESAVKDVYDARLRGEAARAVLQGARLARRRPRRRRSACAPTASWNVPEPELALVVNARGEIVGYTVGNDVSSRDIEGENPLYLPQAKVYDGSCALGPGIHARRRRASSRRT